MFICLGPMTLAAVYYWTFRHSFPAAADLRNADAIICLSAGVRTGNRLGPFSAQRTRACVDLYENRVAPVILFTGGNSNPASPPTAALMADMAMALGVPRHAIEIEPRALSTLQNALFTTRVLGEGAGMVIVTDSFHLPRAAASFYWSGARDLQLYAANSVTPPELPDGRTLRWEVVKIWGNLARAPLYAMAGWIGIPDETRDALLN